MLGACVENWTASNGFTTFSIGNVANALYGKRSDSAVSPKAALSHQWSANTVLKVSTGRAVRFPTVSELYGATATVNSMFINDPNLKLEKSWTTEFSAESDRFDQALSATLGARYSGWQFSTLNNTDVNGFAYQGASKYFTTDVRVRLQVSKQWTAALGIDNLKNYQY